MIDPARLSAAALRVLPRKEMSASVGRLADIPAGPLARAAIRAFVRIYGVDLGEAQVPRGGFRTFDEFFTRQLTAGARPVDPDENVVISPADGRLEDFGPIDLDATLTVKSRPYSVAELLGSAEEAERYAGGHFFIVYLSPRDYHRVHAPASGPITQLRYVPGTLYPVNRIGLDHVPNLFAKNERVVIQQNGPFGVVSTIMVGAIGVGRISVVFDDLTTNVGQTPGLRLYGEDGPPMSRGEELGLFHLGSTAIVFVGPDHPLEFVVKPGDSTRVGRAVARRVAS